jgi:hypothetical protein
MLHPRELLQKLHAAQFSAGCSAERKADALSGMAVIDLLLLLVLFGVYLALSEYHSQPTDLLLVGYRCSHGPSPPWCVPYSLHTHASTAPCPHLFHP